MAEVKTIMQFQKNFDASHGWAWDWSSDVGQNVQNLQKGVVALTGEVGEFANLVKKAGREHGAGNALPDDIVDKMREELVDMFIYLIKLALLLDMDLSDDYYKKMAFNAERFKRFEVKGE
jgi:NTP pyrophosphatase (non-canonical NTP hydrolase)